MTAIALATSRDLSSLIDDDASFVAALRDRDVTADPVVWSDEDVDWGDYDAVVVRSCWDYYRRPGEFEAWISTVERASCTVVNSPGTLHWNRHKFYLRDLEDRDIPTLPTAYVEQGSDIDLGALLDRRGWDEVVVKPAVSAGAFETKRLTRTETAEEAEWFGALQSDHDLLVQAYADEIEGGEWSVVFFGGEYSHAVLKRPKTGDFRVQDDFGGSVDVRSASESLRNQTRAVVDAVADVVGETPLYARVDGVERDGVFHLVEVELIEPELFFRADPRAGDRLAALLVNRL